MGLQLGHHQKYYISRCEEKQSIQLTITVKGDDRRSVEERRELIDDVIQLLDDIMKVFMREVKKPTLMVPCPLCPILHITLKEVSTGHTIFCPHSDDEELPSDYYGDLIPESSDHIPTTGDPTLIPRRDDTIPRRDDTIPRGDGSALRTGIVTSLYINVQCDCYSVS